jgi:hypothetical protein
MPSIVLKVTLLASTLDEREPRAGGPLFRGNGDIDYLCGNCGFVIVAGFATRQHVTVNKTTCPACGATNEFPVELQA